MEGTCDRCGMDLSLASEPIAADSHRYCCRGCRNDTGCTCLNR